MSSANRFEFLRLFFHIFLNFFSWFLQKFRFSSILKIFQRLFASKYFKNNNFSNFFQKIMKSEEILLILWPSSSLSSSLREEITESWCLSINWKVRLLWRGAAKSLREEKLGWRFSDWISSRNSSSKTSPSAKSSNGGSFTLKLSYLSELFVFYFGNFVIFYYFSLSFWP